MALEAGGSSKAEQASLPADVALAWASLKRAKAVLQRLENGLERQEWSHTWRVRRPEWDTNGEPSQDREDAKDTIWMDPKARDSSPCRCRLEGDLLEKQDVRGASSLPAGVHPAGSNSDSRRTCPPDAQQDPQLAMPALALSRPPARLSCSCPSQEEAVAPAAGALPLPISKGSLAYLGTASGPRKNASPRQLASAPATPSPVQGKRRLAWQLEGLKENSPEDLKLQKLKALIQEQRQRHLSWQRGRGDLCSFREGPLGWQHPLKRKICKLAMAAAIENPGFKAEGLLPREEKGASGSQEPLTYPEQKSATSKSRPQTAGCRGRAPRMRKRPGPSHVAPVPGKSWKKRGAHPFGASAWREGQRLARKILGPLLEPLKQRRSTEEEAVPTSGTGAKAEPGREPSALSWVKEIPSSEQRSPQSGQSEADEAHGATDVAGVGKSRRVSPGAHSRSLKARGKEAEQQPRPVSRKETREPNPDSGSVEASHSLEVMNSPAIAPLQQDPGGPSTNNRGRMRNNCGTTVGGCGRLNGSSQRSSPLHSPTGKESQPASGDRWKGCRRHPYSPEEVQEFMIKKVALRNKRAQAAKQASEQANEARSRRLQEVYRKQRAARGRKRSRMEAPQQTASSVALDRQDRKSGQVCMAGDGQPHWSHEPLKQRHSTKEEAVPTSGTSAKAEPGREPSALSWVSESSVALDKQDCKSGQGDRPSDVVGWIRQASATLLRNEPKGGSSTLKMARRAKRSRMPDSAFSLTPQGRAGSPLKLRDLAAPSPLPQCPPPEIPFLMPTSPSGWSRHRSTHNRIRAVQRLAGELSARVESAVVQLRMAERPVDWGWLPGVLALPEKPERVFGPEAPWQAFGETPEAGGLPKSSHFQSPSARALLSQEKTAHEESRAVAQDPTEVGLYCFLAASPGQPSSEEKPSMVHGKGQKADLEGGASVPRFPTEGFLTPEKPRAASSRPDPLFFTDRMVADSSMVDSPEVLCQTSGMENCREKQPEKLDLQKTQEAGFQLGQCLSPSQQPQASVHPLPSANLTHSKAALTEESGDRSEATSQWSEAGQFYGRSSTFCRFGLKMVKQSLQEEELHARHQHALLRLREQALQEQGRAELAWLEHQKRLQGAEDVSVTAKDRLLTRLKQEQAEILHLQNVCRAAHQRRKLLLRQHKELLLLRQSTEQLWRQMRPLAGTPHHQVGAGTLADFEGAVVPEKDENTKASSPALDITSSGDRNNFDLLHGRDCNNLHTERGEILSPRTETAEQKFRPEAPCAAPLDMAVENLHSRRERATSPPPWAGSVTETADQEHKEHPDLTTRPKEDHCHASFNKETAAVSWEILASEVSFATLRRPSPEKGDLQFDSEFHKAHAVLVNISGSTPSASDLETEASQTTDVSLPEEFVFQDPLHESCGAAHLPDTSAVPQVASEENTWLRNPRDPSCDDSEADGPVLQSQEKLLNTAGTYQSDATVLSHSETPRSNPPRAGGSSSQADTSPGRQNARFPNASALLPCVENSSVNKMAFQGRPPSASAASLGGAAVQRPENWRKQSPTSPIGIAERDANRGQHSSPRATDAQPIDYAHEGALKNRDSTSDPVLLPSDQTQPSCFSKDLHVPDSKASSMEHFAEAVRVSHVVSLSCGGPTVEERAQEHQSVSATTSQNEKESERKCHLSSPSAGNIFQSLKRKGSPVFVSNEMEDDIQSPVDEVLTYGSSDLPSLDTSFDLPAPPEDLSDDDSHFTLKDFPSPPEQLLFPETGELEYCMEEDASVQTNNVPSLLLENPVQETLGRPSLAETGMASAQLPSGFSSSKNS